MLLCPILHPTQCLLRSPRVQYPIWGLQCQWQMPNNFMFSSWNRSFSYNFSMKERKMLAWCPNCFNWICKSNSNANAFGHQRQENLDNTKIKESLRAVYSIWIVKMRCRSKIAQHGAAEDQVLRTQTDSGENKGRPNSDAHKPARKKRESLLNLKTRISFKPSNGRKNRHGKASEGLNTACTQF
jgi:hypothetical protein